MRRLWERFSPERELSQREVRRHGAEAILPLLARLWGR